MNRAISASAGTGKTYRLAHRFLGLLSSGVQPDHICALTFSRKAAGEIFDRIVEHLCAAATDARKRARTAATITKEGLIAPPDQPVAYINLLRTLLNYEHRLRIGTLDSFILGVVRAFPLELGVPPEMQPMDGDGGEALLARNALLTNIFDPTRRSDTTGSHTNDNFLQSFRLACFGTETKKLGSILDTLITDYYNFYRQHNTQAWHWGALEHLWQPAEQWWENSGKHALTLPVDLQDRLATAFGPGKNPEKLVATCTEIMLAAMTHAADKPWPANKSPVFMRLLTCAAQDSQPVISYSRKGYTIPADLWRPMRLALGNLIHVEITRALNRTQGLRAVLDRYHTLYTDALSSGGRFTFDDLSRLLGTDGLAPSSNPAAANRLYIDYRLDGKLDHWLLDEFQDTSDTQWAALANLIDEVVQDENRSFFYVGDVKQSVYGWRGGNHRLFGQILEQYSDMGPRSIVGESIAECHRSLPSVINTVNAVFDNLPDWEPEAGAAKGPRPAAVAAFAKVWQKHESARRNEGAGFAALLEYAKGSERGGAETGDNEDENSAENSPDDPAEFEAVARVLAHVQPARRGLTAAVLVRDNKAGRTCVDVLRRQLIDMPVVHEGKGGIVDNPVVTLLLALVRYAAHPGDGVALRHLQLSPLSEEPNVRNFKPLPGLILTAIHDRGFAGTLREWGHKLGALDPFGQQRLRELLAAAEQFDATGSRNADDFADHVDAYQVKSSAAAGTVRVMTIHQAKGLGFDLVIVPFAPKARGFEKPGDPELLAGTDWVLDPPCHQALEAAAGTPLHTLDAARANANFAQLCTLYVALTRAQQALYLLIPEKGQISATVREADLLREQLAAEAPPGTGPGGLTQLHADGDAAWFERSTRTAPSTTLTAPAKVCVSYAAEVVRREPSKDQAGAETFPAQWLFKKESGDVLAFGSAIHRLFQKIEWLEDADLARVIAVWRNESAEPTTLLDEVEGQFRNCLSNHEVRQQLNRPAGAVHAEVWREAPFNLILDANGTPSLLSGRFDRLMVERNAAGRPVRATIFDFKSNRVANDRELRVAADGYAVQMADYALAAARLLGLSPAQITTYLLFTRVGRLLVGHPQVAGFVKVIPLQSITTHKAPTKVEYDNK